MANPARLRAEEQFAMVKRRRKRALSEMEKARQERQEKVARLRALRLAKEVSDKKTADKAATKKGGRTKQHRRKR